MAAAAYLLLPLTGMTAYFLGRTARVRFQGMQAVLLGLAWSVLLFASSALTPVVTQAAFVLGGLLWIFQIVSAAIGRDVRLPVVGAYCARAVELDGVEES